MEDWAYGASWSRPGPVRCAPGAGRFSHYGAERTAYNNVTHRSPPPAPPGGGVGPVLDRCLIGFGPVFDQWLTIA